MPTGRALGYGLGVALAVAGLGAGWLYLRERDLPWIVAGGLGVVASAALFAWLGATQTNRHKDWVLRLQASHAEVGDRFAKDPAAAARFGLYVVIWTVAAAAFGVLTHRRLGLVLARRGRRVRDHDAHVAGCCSARNLSRASPPDERLPDAVAVPPERRGRGLAGTRRGRLRALPHRVAGSRCPAGDRDQRAGRRPAPRSRRTPGRGDGTPVHHPRCRAEPPHGRGGATDLGRGARAGAGRRPVRRPDRSGLGRRARPARGDAVLARAARVCRAGRSRGPDGPVRAGAGVLLPVDGHAPPTAQPHPR